MPPPTPPIFLASLGNPPPNYHRTLHSAGHLLLSALADTLADSTPTWSPAYHAERTCTTTLPRSNSRLTLWESPTLMNVSGPTMVKAFQSWCQQTALEMPPGSAEKLSLSKAGSTTAGVVARKAALPTAKATLKKPSLVPLNLILLHDDLDLAPGKLRVRRGRAAMSARGHNGVKSVVASLVKEGLMAQTHEQAKNRRGISAGRTEQISLPVTVQLPAAAGNKGAEMEGDAETETETGILPKQLQVPETGMSISTTVDIWLTRIVLTRIGIGIGRPRCRNSAEVAEYVLREFSRRQEEVVRELAGELVEMLETEVKGMMRGGFEDGGRGGVFLF
ncbi:aminoacyl-tRNA hydrolase [Onygenales sp. PD_10]|nr:aminoacyl-tRNA hydrolase [Onygenales sp. PD_10]